MVVTYLRIVLSAKNWQIWSTRSLECDKRTFPGGHTLVTRKHGETWGRFRCFCLSTDNFRRIHDNNMVSFARQSAWPAGNPVPSS